MRFEWDPLKAIRNEAKHGISFEIALEVFADPFAFTVSDESHSETEQRSVTIGSTMIGLMVTVIHTDRDGNIRLISARRATRHDTKSIAMKEEKIDGVDDMLSEYDFTDGVRGKYYEHFKNMVTVVPLEKDVAEVFTDSKQINEILRALIPIVKKPEATQSEEERLAS